jgi:hypothetical protein
MSTPYTPVGGTQAGDYDDAHGQGLVTFAGVMILTLDIIVIYGLLAYGGRRRSAREARTRAQTSAAS